MEATPNTPRDRVRTLAALRDEAKAGGISIDRLHRHARNLSRSTVYRALYGEGSVSAINLEELDAALDAAIVEKKGEDADAA